MTAWHWRRTGIGFAAVTAVVAVTAVFAATVVVAVTVAGVVAARSPGAGTGAAETVGPVVLTQWPVGAPLDAEGLVNGCRIVTYDPADGQGAVRVLTAMFSAASLGDVSFDGQRILFVGRQGADETATVWEMGVDGGGLRKVTDGPGHCLTAIYLSTFYSYSWLTEEPAPRIAVCGRERPGDPPALYTCRLDGSRLLRITYLPDGGIDPIALSDGRVLFSDRGRRLFTVNTDGTDVFLFTDVGAPVDGSSESAKEDASVRARMACETYDDEVAFVELVDSDLNDHAQTGVGVINETPRGLKPAARGRRGGAPDRLDARALDRGGRVAAVSVTRSLKTHRVIAGSSDGGYLYPAALSPGRLLVSFQPAGGESYGLCVVDTTTGERSALSLDAPEWHELSARPIRSRPMPAGRSSSVDERRTSGVLYCLDAYLTGTTRAEPTERDAITAVRVEAWMKDDKDASASARVLGEMPVEPDGSFAMEVPARTALRLAMLNGAGRVLGGMESWFWVMPRENRGCIGCHEDRELAPPNRFARALRRAPQRIGLGEPASEGRP